MKTKELEVIRLGNEVVLGYQEELESKVFPVCLHQTAGQVGDLLREGRNRRIPCLCGRTLNYTLVCCVEVTLFICENIK